MYFSSILNLFRVRWPGEDLVRGATKVNKGSSTSLVIRRSVYGKCCLGRPSQTFFDTLHEEVERNITAEPVTCVINEKYEDLRRTFLLNLFR